MYEFCASNSLERAIDALWVYECDFIRCFDHTCGHLQGCKSENADIFTMFQDHSTVKIGTVASKMPVKWLNIAECKILEANFHL
jgi:hypothetical protein